MGKFDAHHSPSLGSLDQQDFFQVSPQIGDCRSTHKRFRIFLRMGATLNNDDLPPFIFGGSFSVFCVDVTWAARIDARRRFAQSMRPLPPHDGDPPTGQEESKSECFSNEKEDGQNTQKERDTQAQ